jgi:hypothetical protein
VAHPFSTGVAHVIMGRDHFFGQFKFIALTENLAEEILYLHGVIVYDILLVVMSSTLFSTASRSLKNWRSDKAIKTVGLTGKAISILAEKNESKSKVLSLAELKSGKDVVLSNKTLEKILNDAPLIINM